MAEKKSPAERTPQDRLDEAQEAFGECQEEEITCRIIARKRKDAVHPIELFDPLTRATLAVPSTYVEAQYMKSFEEHCDQQEYMKKFLRSDWWNT